MTLGHVRMEHDVQMQCDDGINAVIEIPTPCGTGIADEDLSSLMATGPPAFDRNNPIIDDPNMVRQDGEVEDPLHEVELPNHPADDDFHDDPDSPQSDRTRLEGMTERLSTVLFQLHFDALHVRIADHDFL